MNLSNLITRIKYELGIYTIALPVPNIDEYIANIIKNFTLRDYSQCFPQFDSVIITGEDIRKAEEKRTSYDYIEVRIKLDGNTEIVMIEDVRPCLNTAYGFGYYATGMPLYGASSLGDLLTTSIGTNISNQVIPKITYNFVSPNIVQLFNMYYYTGDLKCDYRKLHDPNLSSIPFSQEATFTEIAIIDCKRYLYEIVKHYNELESAHGRVGLKIDDWQEAKNNRQELISRWDDAFHLEQGYPRYA